MTISIPKLIEDMGEFASNTKNDRLSVIVARTASKLEHAGVVFERHYTGNLTVEDWKIIRPFIRKQIKKAA